MTVTLPYVLELKSRFKADGFKNFTDEEILDLLIFCASSISDTGGREIKIPSGEELLRPCCGSLSAFLSTPFAELKSTPGLSQNAASFLKLIPDIARHCQLPDRDRAVLYSSERAGAYLIPLFRYEKEELFVAVCVDRNLNLLSCHELFRGTVTGTDISLRKILEIALTQKADGIIIAHNHLSGIAIPSENDIATTQALKDALDSVGTLLVDHIIVAGDDFVSFHDSKSVVSPLEGFNFGFGSEANESRRKSTAVRLDE